MRQIKTVRRSDSLLFDEDVNRSLKAGWKMIGEPTHVMTTEQAYNSRRPETIIVHMVTLELIDETD